MGLTDSSNVVLVLGSDPAINTFFPVFLFNNLDQSSLLLINSPSIFSIITPGLMAVVALLKGPPSKTSETFNPLPAYVSSYNKPHTAVASAFIV